MTVQHLQCNCQERCETINRKEGKIRYPRHNTALSCMKWSDWITKECLLYVDLSLGNKFMHLTYSLKCLLVLLTLIFSDVRDCWYGKICPCISNMGVYASLQMEFH